MDDAVESYLTELARTEHEDPVLVEMEARAAEHGFPIVGRATGRFLELAARAIGARRVMELGSGYGYSAYWFARAVGPDGEVVCTDGDPENAKLAEDYLSTAGVWDRVRYRVGDALHGFAEEAGDFDVVYCDVDKDGYPACWRAARDRIRVGGLWLCDNTLWSGHVATATDKAGRDRRYRLHPGAQPPGRRRHPVRRQHCANPRRRDDGLADQVTQAHPPVDSSPLMQLVGRTLLAAGQVLQIQVGAALDGGPGGPPAGGHSRISSIERSAGSAFGNARPSPGASWVACRVGEATGAALQRRSRSPRCDAAGRRR